MEHAQPTLAKTNTNRKIAIGIWRFASCMLAVQLLFCTAQIDQVKANEVSLTTKPAVLTVQAQPDSKTSQSFIIVNNTTSSVDLRLILKPFRAADDEGTIMYLTPQIAAGSREDAFLKYVQVVDKSEAVTQITLAPKQEKQLTLVINTPQESLLVDHYFTIIFLTSPPQPQVQNKESLSVVQTGIALPVLLAVGGKDPEKSFLQDFSTPFFAQQGPIPFTISLANRGQHFVSPKGIILVKNMFGQTVGRITATESNVLSGTNRKETKVWQEKVLFGIYQATLSVTFSDQGPLATKTIYFLVFPLYSLAIIGAALILTGLYIIKIRQRLKQE